MTLTRKEFFKQSFYGLADTLLKVGGAGPKESANGADLMTQDESEEGPVPDQSKVARADNRYCLAKSCGCFSCVERCEAGAIVVVMGEGIRINEGRCTGCGTCQYLCPVTPKAVALHHRGTAS